MPSAENKREAIRAYKERGQIGAVYRIVNTATGWRSEYLVTPDIAGLHGRIAFSKNTNLPISGVPQAQWAQHAPAVFEVEEVERLKRKEGQAPSEFRKELAELLEVAETIHN